MDTGWLDQQVESIKQGDARARHREEVRLHDARVIESQAPQFWDDLIASLEEYAAALNERLSGQIEHRITLTHGKGRNFSLVAGPMSIHCGLDVLGRKIKFSSTGGCPVIGGRPITDSCLVTFDVGTNGFRVNFGSRFLQGVEELAKDIIGFAAEQCVRT